MTRATALAPLLGVALVGLVACTTADASDTGPTGSAATADGNGPATTATAANPGAGAEADLQRPEVDRTADGAPTEAPTDASAPPDEAAPNGATAAAPDDEPGPGGLRPAPCGDVPPDMVCVPGGWFVRGVDRDDDGCVQADEPSSGPATMPAMRVWQQTVWYDRHEVTIGDWEACRKAGACRKSGPSYMDFDRPKQPHTGGSWFDARDYCAWRGKRLPTETEFEHAARGPDGARTPFGDALVTCEEAVVMDASGRSCGTQKRGNHPEKGRVLEIGSRPAGRYGIHDLAGNAEEWVADWWTPSWETCGEACAGPSPRGPCGGDEPCPRMRFRVVRGGSWYWGPECATGYRRRRHVPSNDPMHHFGFRCAADPGAEVRPAP